MLTLLVLQGPDKGQRFELPEEPLVVGRVAAGMAHVGGGGAQIPLTDNTVSRRHCEIQPRDGVYVLKDLGSANGSYINGLRVRTPQVIRVGDQLRVGRTLLAFGSQPGMRAAKDGEVQMSGVESGMDSAIMHTVAVNDESMVLSVPEPTAAAVNNLQILYQLGAALGSSFDAQQAMAITLDLVFEHVRAERGMVLLRDEKTGELAPVIVRTREKDEKDAPTGDVRIHASRTIVDHVLKTGEGVLSSNAMEDKRFSKGKSVHSMTIRSALCVPIKARRLGAPADLTKQAAAAAEVIGMIYIDSSKKNYTYSPDQLKLLSAIGLQAGMAVQNANLYQAGIRAERLAAIGETTAALSHSIKNILQAIRGGADLVEMGLNADNVQQAKKGWGVVGRNIDRIYSLTRNLLAYSRPRTSQAELVNPALIVRDCVETVAGQANEKGAMVIADIDEDHPPVPMDEGAIHQVLMNLMVNALEAVEQDKGLVRVVSRFDADSEEAVMEVTDNGPGIAPTMQRHLFELFHSTKGNRGTGLGLAVSRKIVEEHEGSVTVDSGAEQQKGTTFRIRLPVRRLSAAPDSGGSEFAGSRQADAEPPR